MIVSIWQRDSRRDLTGDAWNGRTLEWSTASPAPVYNFAIIPIVTERDAFWVQKQAARKKTDRSADKPSHPTYQDIALPRNSGAGVFIAGFAFCIGFGLVWHIWWLSVAGLIGIVTTVIVRVSAEETDYIIPASEVARIEQMAAMRKAEGAF